MTIIKQDKLTGKYYLARGQKPNRDWWIVKHQRMVDIKQISIPKSWFGRKIRFNVEILDESPLKDFKS